MQPTTTGAHHGVDVADLATGTGGFAIDVHGLAGDVVTAVAVVAVLLGAAVVVGGAIGLRLGEFRTRYGSSYDHDLDELTNCPECGARIPIADRCDYCDSLLLPGDVEPASASGDDPTPEPSTDVPLDRRK